MEVKPEPITCKAVIAWGPNEPLTIENITVDPPKKGEVRIRMLYTSVCHTDAYILRGSNPNSSWPHILGHEGAGQVESIGEGVSLVKKGDFVIPLFCGSCGDCDLCANPKTNLCSKLPVRLEDGSLFDGTSRFSLNGQRINHFMVTSTFSEYTVVVEKCLAKLVGDVNLEEVSILGCGVSTGYGSALNTANVQPGETVVIFGLGTVGLAAALGCKHRGASRIIGVDTNNRKRDISGLFGITDFVNPNEQDESVDKVLMDMTQGGVDCAFECGGRIESMELAFNASQRFWGRTIIVGCAEIEAKMSISPFDFLYGRSISGCVFGGYVGPEDVPKLAEQHKRGELELGLFVTHRKKGIESILDAFELLKTGESLRCVVSL